MDTLASKDPPRISHRTCMINLGDIVYTLSVIRLRLVLHCLSSPPNNSCDDRHAAACALILPVALSSRFALSYGDKELETNPPNFFFVV